MSMATAQQRPRATGKGARSKVKSGRVPSSTDVSSTHRSFQAINTSVSAYDRTDPFAAFDTLRKLMTMLPSRPGGHQYKLSSEEHTLVAHLLSIVEPFVGLEPSRRRIITHQPTEILDEIASNLPSKRDLLALGLTCKRLHDVIFPRHYSYREIVAKNVRKLEILDERAPDAAKRIPKGMMVRGKTDTDFESSDDESNLRNDKLAKVFVAALSRMVRLETFVWSCNHSLIDLHAIWPTLLHRASLKTMDINDNIIFRPNDISDEDTIGKKHASKLMLPKVSAVSVQSFKKGVGQTKTPELTQILDMLNHCPNLEELDIKYNANSSGGSSPNAASFFHLGRWSSLRTLALSNLLCGNAASDAIAKFLAVHTGLEGLHLELGRNNAGALSDVILFPGTIPRLRELTGPKDFANIVMGCPTSEGNTACNRPLETLRGIRLTGGGTSDLRFLANVRRHPVKRVELAGYSEFEDIKRLVSSVPNITWLDVGKKLGGGVAACHSVSDQKSKVPGGIVASAVDWTDVLSQLPELTTLHGVRFFYEVAENVVHHSGSSMGSVNSNGGAGQFPYPPGAGGMPPQPPLSHSDRSRIKKNDELASVLAWKCPKLRRVDHWDEHGGKIIILVRDGGGGEVEKMKVRLEMRRLKS